MNTKTIAYVVLGLDKDGKPRAATIPFADLEVATKAAGSMELKIGRADTPEALALAKGLPQVRIFATGKGLVPLVKKELYERLSKAVAIIEARPTADVNPPVKAAADPKADPKAGPEKDSEAAPAPSPFNLWSQIQVGGVVLWQGAPKEGWFECQVIEISRDRKKLKLKWRDYPNFKAFEVPRNAVGLISVIR